MKRLVRDGHVLAVPQERDKPYLYMPNPALIHLKSMKTDHFLGLVDIFIQLKQPPIYEVEPIVNDDYRPDAYTRIDGAPVIIEYQRTIISSKRIEYKVNAFVESFYRKQHDAKTLMIVTDHPYKVGTPPGFTVLQKQIGAL